MIKKILINKLFSPLVYTSVLVPLFLGVIAVYAAISENLIVKIGSYYGFYLSEIFVFLLNTIALATPIFLSTNLFIIHFEKLKERHVSDHIRQSFIYYVVIICGFIYLSLHKTLAGIPEILTSILVTISFLGVAFNAYSLYLNDSLKIKQLTVKSVWLLVVVICVYSLAIFAIS